MFIVKIYTHPLSTSEASDITDITEIKCLLIAKEPSRTPTHIFVVRVFSVKCLEEGSHGHIQQSAEYLNILIFGYLDIRLSDPSVQL